MKKTCKKVIAFSLAVAMGMAMTACGSTQSAKTNNQAADHMPTDAKANDYSRFQKRDKMELSIACWNVGDAISSGDDAVRDAIYKKLNITVKPYQMTWGDYTQKVSVWAASKNLPDITCCDTAFSENFDKWVDGKVVAQVPDDLSAYPNLAKTLTVDKTQSENYRAKDGHFYGIPKVQTTNPMSGITDVAIMMRRDWAKKVGVTKSPETVDEFIDVISKIPKSDPDGNGKNDTIGLTAYALPWMTSIFSASEPGLINGYQWVWKGDKLIRAYNSDRFMQAAKDVNKMYKAGIIDPDLPSLKGEEGRDKFKNGKAVAYGHSNGAAGYDNMQSMAKDGQKLSDVLMNVYPFKNMDGNYYYVSSNVYWSETYFKYGMSPEKMDTCLALMDYMLSEEGHNYMAYGIEGEDYTKDASGHIVLKKNADGTLPTLTDKYPFMKLSSLAVWGAYFDATNVNYSEEVRGLVQDNYDWAKKVNIKQYDSPITGPISFPDKAKDTATSQNYQADILTLMKSDDVEADVAKIREKYKNAGGDKIEKEMNEAAQKRGLKPLAESK